MLAHFHKLYRDMQFKNEWAVINQYCIYISYFMRLIIDM